MERKKRPQLRRCTACNAVGHNRATCPKERAELARVSASTLKFFVHHVKAEPPTSPHIIDLKATDKTLWQSVDTAASKTPAPEAFHTYHELPSNNAQPITNDHKEAQKTELPLPPVTPGVKLHKLNSKDTEPKQPFWQQLKQVLPIKQMSVTLVVITLISIIPGRVWSYYESLKETKAIIAENSTDGFLALQQSTIALKNADLATAANATTIAENKFNAALGELQTKHQVLQTIVSAIPVLHGELQSREKILLAGQEIAIGNSFLLTGLQNAKAKTGAPLTDTIDEITNALHSALPNYTKAVDNLNAVDPSSVPTQYQAQFNDYRTVFSSVVNDFKNIAELGGSLQEIFGGAGQRRYLLVFQNPSELRPTGGFMGSFAILDIKDGKVVKLDVPAGGTYDLQGQLSEYVIPPLPLTLSNKRWEFQDANWFPDFPASAKKILWFYNHSRNVTADGVIAINATVLERLLGIIGPISSDMRGVTLDASTVLSTLQATVETGNEKNQNKPKQILADFAPLLVHAVTSTPTNTVLPLLESLSDALSQKEIQAYFSDDQTENIINTYGWSGRIAETPDTTDYLMLINTNIQGQKSDARIKQSVSHQAVIDENGAITDTVIITREHTGKSGDSLYGVPNIDYIRLYVPKGSELLSASGFAWPDEKNFRAPESWYTVDEDLRSLETNILIDDTSGTRISNEFGKTSFGNWLVTAPGSVSQAVFTYRLPFKLATTIEEPNSLISSVLKPLGSSLSKYSLMVQKQSGITSDFESQVLLPNGWSTHWVSDQTFTMASNGFRTMRSSLTHDILWSALLTNSNS